MSKSIKHIHKYRRIKLKPSGKFIFRCMLPDCSHYISQQFIKGKKCICWRCGEVFVIEREHEHMAKPHCSNCIIRRGKTDISDKEIGSLLFNEDIDSIMEQFRK